MLIFEGVNATHFSGWDNLRHNVCKFIQVAEKTDLSQVSSSSNHLSSMFFQKKMGEESASRDNPVTSYNFGPYDRLKGVMGPL